jgi:hypothetical protein
MRDAESRRFRNQPEARRRFSNSAQAISHGDPDSLGSMRMIM